MATKKAKKASKKASKKKLVKKAVSKRCNSLPEAPAYNRVVESATLEAIRLIESNFFVRPNFFVESEEDDRRFTRSHKMVGFVYDEDDGTFTASFRFEVCAEREEVKVLECTALYVVFFTLSEGVDEDSTRAFAERTGKNATYPYFRQFVSSQSWASGADLPIMPILKFVPPRRTG